VPLGAGDFLAVEDWQLPCYGEDSEGVGDLPFCFVSAILQRRRILYALYGIYRY
jgi:hypothetical protein